jgi:carbon monoxide dehydrogenase subunit G
MSVDVTVTAAIPRPPDVVIAFVTDPANDPRWIGGIQSARKLGGEPVGVGTRVERVARFLGRRIEYVNEITQLAPNRLAMQSVKAPFPMQVAYDVRDRGSGTEMSIHVAGGPGGLAGLASPLLGLMVRRNLRRDLEGLARELGDQSDGGASPAR